MNNPGMPLNGPDSPKIYPLYRVGMSRVPALSACLIALLTSAVAGGQIKLVPTLRVHIDAVETVAYDNASDAFIVSAAEGIVRVTRDGHVKAIVTNEQAAGEGAEITHVTIHPSDASRAFATVLPPDPCVSVGFLVEFNSTTGQIAARTPVGFHPDSVAIDPTTGTIVVANEGEVRTCTFGDVDAVFDPFGSITLIRPPYASPTNRTHITLDDSLKQALIEGQDIRIHPGADRPAADLEPEYITIKDSKAYITLQENSAILKVDLVSHQASLHQLTPITQTLDADKSDGPAVIHTTTTLPMPDMLAAVEPPRKQRHVWNAAGLPYVIVTANEGDTRGSQDDNGPMPDETQASELPEHARESRPASAKVSSFPNRSGQHSMFGSRSISIHAPNTLERISDTGSAFEDWFASNAPSAFNANTNNPAKPDNRSDDRGPEPEGITTALIHGRAIAFVTLERPGAIAVVDISNPFEPTLLTIEPTYALGDRAPEGIVFVPLNDQIRGNPLLAVAFEGSSTFVIYEIQTAITSRQ